MDLPHSDAGESGLVSLDDIDITRQLRHRPSRLPEYEAESRAMAQLMEEVARTTTTSPASAETADDGPMAVFRNLVRTALRLCDAHSGGVSILERENGADVFRWHAAAGKWTNFLGEVTPRAGSLCGVVIERNCGLLLSHPERLYPAYLGPPIIEAMLVPFHQEDVPVGTLWVATHDFSRQFDSEDFRLLKSLARFASLAYQLVNERRQRLAEELADSLLLHRISAELIQEDHAQALYEKLVDAAVAIMRSDFASLQMLHPDRGGAGSSGKLRLLAFRGFTPEASRFWKWVRADSGSTCGTALRTAKRSIASDIEQCPDAIGTEDLDMYRQAGIRSVQTTPLFSRSGKLVGMISTHWRHRHEPTQRSLRLFDILAREAADFIERQHHQDELLRAEQALRRSQMQLTEALTTARMAAWDWTPNVDHGSVTATISEVFGLLPGQVLESAEDAFSLVHPEDLEAHRALMQQSAEHGRSWQTEFRIIRPRDGRIAWLEARGIASRDAETGHVRMTGLVWDITGRKHAEEELRQLNLALAEGNRKKDEFLATLAHELRNPLAPIKSSIEILLMSSNNDARLERVCQMMERQVNHMVRLVDDLMEASRITRGTIPFSREETNLAAVIRSALDVSAPLIKASGHHLEVSIPPEPVPICGDPVRLAQVVSNLLNNAAKYTDCPGQIWLDGHQEADEVVISVRDTGIGIPAEKLPQIFDMFMQVDRSRERAQGGLGIGLTLVKRLVDMHDGKIEARSAGPGQGTEVVVRLPIGSHPAAGEKASPAPSPGLAHRRVLIVDDNLDAATSLGMLVKILGADVEIANDGPTALSKMDAYHPQAVLLDIGMPGMDGIEVARRTRSRPEFDRTVLIALTGWGQESDREKTRAAGFDHHLVKPAGLMELQNVLTSERRSPDLSDHPD